MTDTDFFYLLTLPPPLLGTLTRRSTGFLLPPPNRAFLLRFVRITVFFFSSSSTFYNLHKFDPPGEGEREYQQRIRRRRKKKRQVTRFSEEERRGGERGISRQLQVAVQGGPPTRRSYLLFLPFLDLSDLFSLSFLFPRQHTDLLMSPSLLPKRFLRPHRSTAKGATLPLPSVLNLFTPIFLFCTSFSFSFNAVFLLLLSFFVPRSH